MAGEPAADAAKAEAGVWPPSDARARPALRPRRHEHPLASSCSRPAAGALKAALVATAAKPDYGARVADDLDLRDSAEVRRRVAMPVAGSLLRADALEDVVVEVVVDDRPALGRVNALRVAVKARGEWIEAGRWYVDDSPWDGQSFADGLYRLLQDELAESRLAWGELREGTFEVLPPERL